MMVLANDARAKTEDGTIGLVCTHGSLLRGLQRAGEESGKALTGTRSGTAI